MTDPLENPPGGPEQFDPNEPTPPGTAPPPSSGEDVWTDEDEAMAAEIMTAPTPGLDDDEEPDDDSPEAEDVPPSENPAADTVASTPNPDDEITQDDLRRLAELGTPDLDGDDNPLGLPPSMLDPEEEEDQYDAEGAVDALAQRVAGIDQDLTDLTEEWENRLLPDENPTDVKFYKAQGNWSNAAANGSTVSCKLCTDRTGAGETGDALTAYLFRAGAGDPNVRTGDVIAAVEMPDGTLVCVSDYLDDPIGAIAMASSATDPRIGRGWSIYTTIGGRRPVGYIAEDETYGTPEATGGAATHTHANHADHYHMIVSCQPNGDIAATVGGIFDEVTGGVLDGDAGNLTHAAASHRSPDLVIVFIKRVD